MNTKRIVLFSLTAIIGAAFGVSPAHAVTDPLIEGAKQCTRHLPQYEKQYDIPKHLLSAISSTESGRYHNDLQIMIPWPWTINAAGKGYFFDSKAEAIAAVKKLQKQGVQSIDVGCMQVNLYHHPDAFASLEEAFEPHKNIEYAAGFLRRLYQEKGSWKQAAADYHSKTPGRGSLYVGRVYTSWSRLVDKLRLAQLKIPQSTLNEIKRMKPAAGTQYASANHVKQAEKKVEPYRSPQMRTIKLSDKNVRRENGILIVRPELQAAVLSSDAPSGELIRANDEQPLPSLKTTPNFIFSN